MKPMTKEEVLFDTLQYYTQDVSRRSYNENGLCSYIAKNPLLSEGCAIGRLVSREQAELLNKLNNSVEGLFKNNTTLNFMPEWLVDLGKSFLNHLQNLHDSEEYWNWEENIGLSDEGKAYVTRICISENINTQRIEQFIS